MIEGFDRGRVVRKSRFVFIVYCLVSQSNYMNWNIICAVVADTDIWRNAMAI